MHPLLVGVHYITLTVHSCMFIENLTPLLLFSQRNQSSQKSNEISPKSNIVLYYYSNSKKKLSMEKSVSGTSGENTLIMLYDTKHARTRRQHARKKGRRREREFVLL